MQDVNNDMEDLFRKAAEHYPLKTEGADWQKIAAGLQDEAAPAGEKKEKRKRRALWLFLLLPLALLCGIYHNGFAPSVQDKANEKQMADVISHDENETSSTFSSNDSSAGINYNLDKKIKESSGEVDNTGTTTKDNYRNTVDNDSRKENTIREILGSVSSRFAGTENNTGYSEQKQAMTNRNDDEENNKKIESSPQPLNLYDRIDKAEGTTGLKEEKTDMPLQTENDSLLVNDTKKDSAINNNLAAAVNKSSQIKVKPRVQNGFYAGLLASFDISTVKLQRIDKTGYGFELLMGYRFSKRISVESGITWTKKNYYSTGKYFDKSRTDISPQSKIIYTNGSCAMYEIPAVMKYDFAQRKRSNWFATAGLSSYIMKDESYTYFAIHSGNPYTATKKYSHSGSNLFSVASLSIGYQLQLNKHLSLRAEPYIKMPLSGIGIAKMPITSTGITAGFTRSF